MALDSLVKLTEPSGLKRREQADGRKPWILRWNEGCLVEPRGVEPLTSSLRTRRSPN